MVQKVIDDLIDKFDGAFAKTPSEPIGKIFPILPTGARLMAWIHLAAQAKRLQGL